MASDIFKINRKLIDLSKDLYWFGRGKATDSTLWNEMRRNKFTFPSVVFSDLPDLQLGHYDPSQHLIVIDTSLTSDARTYDLENVYLHELAHAVDFALNKTSNHDGTFVHICKELGVDDKFACAKINSYKPNIKSKIDKLLALSKSDFEGEASSALNKAKQLMMDNGLEYLYADSPDELFGCVFERSRYIHNWKKILFNFIGRITGIFSIESEGVGYKTLNAYGSLEQIETTMYIYNDLVMKIERECKSIVSRLKSHWTVDRVNAVQIKMGIVQGIISKNSDIEKATKGTAIELSTVKNEEIYVRLYNAKFRNVALKSTMSSELMLGMTAGKTIGVSTGKKDIVKQIGSDRR